ncbi:MAG: dolichyl-phosphate beta-glucosyltransferase [Methanoregula sp.]|jgi:glycosyltransferase involved in cell wall biosynthesis|uniref:dolichyl-phosphate beta-glucosyltransferase n=1 Tax=Methanoregula sp. TaxID=2052170 RepID=UPI003D1336E4
MKQVTLRDVHQDRLPEIMTPTPRPQYSLVIPAYNEEKRITLFFDGIPHFEGELIVVCDGTDGTADIIGRIAAERGDLAIRCLRFDHRLGKGGGVMAGLKAAHSSRVGYFDADGSTTIGEMMRLLSCLKESDCVIGSRWVPGSTLTVSQSFMRRIESRMFNLIIRILFGLDFHDTQCGAKVFKKPVIDEILPLMYSTGFEFDVELLWRLKKNGARIMEIPIEWQNKGDSRVQKRDMIRMLFGLLMLIFHRVCA